MDNWVLKPCDDINRILKVREDIKDLGGKERFPCLLTLTHRYATSDDLLFPEAGTLAFFAGFEEKVLNNIKDGYYFAQDIHTGLLKLHLYVKEYENTIYELIEYLKLKPEYHIEFNVAHDEEWDFYLNL